MVGSVIDISSFGGMVPRADPRLLPPNAAQVAINTRLHTGTLSGINTTKVIHDTGSPLNVRAFRFPDPESETGYTWAAFARKDVSVFRGALLNDLYDRVYKFGGGLPPQFTTLERLRNGDPWYRLGVPAPLTAPTVDTVGGQPSETRYYVYTFVSPFGEESAPSIPAGATGDVDSEWTVSDMDVTFPDSGGYPEGFTKRVYRTVSGYTSAEFFLVADIPLEDTTYVDTASDLVVSRNPRLESLNWQAPPVTLEAAVQMPNGFFVAWDGSTIYMSEPYRPHAWPPTYDAATEFGIVGAGVYGQTVIFGTEGAPYAASGVSPAGMTLTKIDSPKPCLSPYGVVPFPDGVVFPTPNGLVHATPAGAKIVTQPFVTHIEWLGRYHPENLVAARYETGYLGFYSDNQGFLIDPSEPNQAFVEMDAFADVDFISTDPYSGDVFAMQNGKVLEWDAQTEGTERFQWRSKRFVFTKPCNLGAVIVEGGVVDDEGDLPVSVQDMLRWNAQRIQSPLDCIGSSYAIGNASAEPPIADPALPANRGGVGGSALYYIFNELLAGSRVVIRVFADGVLVDQRSIETGKPYRLPSGFKARDWEVGIVSYVPIYSIKLAETAKGLERV